MDPRPGVDGTPAGRPGGVGRWLGGAGSWPEPRPVGPEDLAGRVLEPARGGWDPGWQVGGKWEPGLGQPGAGIPNRQAKRAHMSAGPNAAISCLMLEYFFSNI